MITRVSAKRLKMLDLWRGFLENSRCLVDGEDSGCSTRALICQYVRLRFLSTFVKKSFPPFLRKDTIGGKLKV